MTKIVVTNHQDLTSKQKARLDSLGDVTYYESLPTGKEYLERIKGADVICSGTAGLKDVYAQVKDVYITVGFVNVAFLDLNVLKKNNVTISNAPGANKYAVSEWIIAMMIILTRKLDSFLNSNERFRKDGKLPPLVEGLAGRSLTVLGMGNIGTRVGEVAASLGMKVSYFKRGDDLHKLVKNADFVVDTLSSNPSSCGLLGASFFKSMKKGAYFVTVTGSSIINEDAMLKALDEGQLAGVATDCGKILVGDTEDPYYQKFLKHPKVLVTPHVSYNTTLSMKTGGDIMIDNVESWIKGKPQNIVNS
ncbi:MAG: NAD(P)-dependent oxidoreductase [Candidatus Saccharimonadales bacterium]